jgi:hypothetical protein
MTATTATAMQSTDTTEPAHGREIPDLPLAEHVNHTPFPSQYYQTIDQHGQMFHVIALRITYDMASKNATNTHLNNNLLPYAKEQTPLCEEDVCSGDVNDSSPLYESDYAPYKPKCDILVVNAVSRPPMSDWHQAVTRNLDPDSRPKAKRWPCGLSVQWQSNTGKTQTWEKLISVCGPRSFGLLGLSEPQAVSQVAIDWTLAYGGQIKQPEQDQLNSDGSLKTAAGAKQWDTLQANPVGCGFNRSHGKPAPQIEMPSRLLQANPNYQARPSYKDGIQHSSYPSVGLSATAKSWLPRRSHAGTYDDAWQQSQWPLPPLDHDYAFWNCAPLDQQIEHPHSHIEISTARLYGAQQAWPQSSEQERWVGRLPLHQKFVGMASAAKNPQNAQSIDILWREENMDLDTLIIDLKAQQVYAIHRFVFKKSEINGMRLLRLETRMNPLDKPTESIPSNELFPIGT